MTCNWSLRLLLVIVTFYVSMINARSVEYEVGNVDSDRKQPPVLLRYIDYQEDESLINREPSLFPENDNEKIDTEKKEFEKSEDRERRWYFRYNYRYQNPCSHPTAVCYNGGVCVVASSAANTYYCRCGANYRGLRCGQLKPCSWKPCKNGGTCTDLQGNYYKCTCPSNFSGKRCETRKMPCDTSPCKNGGTCTNVGNTYSCNCPQKFSGKLCEKEVKPCDSKPCQNGGTCTNEDNGYTCKCTGVYTGENCEESKDPCHSHPCKNEGHCINEGDTFFCLCSNGFEGKTCEKSKNPCDSHPCKNEGHCIDEGEIFFCICPEGFEGKTCENVDCVGNKIDLVYAVDASVSIGNERFETMKKFLKKLTSHFDISKDTTNIGVVLFSSTSQLELTFNKGITAENVNNAIEEMEYLKGATCTNKALKMTREELFTNKRSEVRCAAKVLILLTDGEASRCHRTQETTSEVLKRESDLLKKAGVSIVTVGIGDESSVKKFREQLKKIASHPDMFYQATFSALDKIANDLVKISCNAQSECKA